MVRKWKLRLDFVAFRFLFVLIRINSKAVHPGIPSLLVCFQPVQPKGKVKTWWKKHREKMLLLLLDKYVSNAVCTSGCSCPVVMSCDSARSCILPQLKLQRSGRCWCFLVLVTCAVHQRVWHGCNSNLLHAVRSNLVLLFVVVCVAQWFLFSPFISKSGVSPAPLVSLITH